VKLCQPNRVEPEFALGITRFSMDMRRIIPFVKVEMKAKSAYSEDFRHDTEPFRLSQHIVTWVS
jgi:hypothetical protein